MVSGICLQSVIKLITHEDALTKRARLFLELMFIGPGILWQSGIKNITHENALAKRARLFFQIIFIGPGIRWQSGIKTCNITFNDARFVFDS